MIISKEELQKIIEEEIESAVNEGMLSDFFGFGSKSDKDPKAPPDKPQAKLPGTKTVVDKNITPMIALYKSIENKSSNAQQVVNSVSSVLNNVVLRSLDLLVNNTKIDERSMKAILADREIIRRMALRIRSMRVGDATVALGTAAMPDNAGVPDTVKEPAKSDASNAKADAMRSGGGFSGRGYRE